MNNLFVINQTNIFTEPEGIYNVTWIHDKILFLISTYRE